MIEYVSTYYLKSYNTPECTPLEMILKEPHAWITHNKSALPSDVIFYIPIHLLNHQLINITNNIVTNIILEHLLNMLYIFLILIHVLKTQTKRLMQMQRSILLLDQLKVVLNLSYHNNMKDL
jgi:hypothetical protein